MSTEICLLTNEQITQYVHGMRAQLDTCVSKGQAYRVKWSDVKTIIAIILTLQDRAREANDCGNDIVEREAACCPEDVPFDEYIRALEKQNAALREQLAQANEKNAWKAYQAVAESVIANSAGELADQVRGLEFAATRMRDKCVSEILVMKAEHIARGDLPLGRRVFDEITNRVHSLTLESGRAGETSKS